MNLPCAKCGAHLESMWSFCPHCGAVITHAMPAEPVHAEHEKSPVKGAFGGLLLGFVAAPVLLIVGSLLLITGVGALPGILMIVGGVLAPLAGPVLGMNAVRGHCPWCGAEVSSVALIDRFACDACKGKIVVRHRELLKAG